MSSFAPKRAIGIMFAVLANLCFAAGNLFTSSYPSSGGVFLWRGLGSSGVLLLRKRRFNSKTVLLGLSHASHMLAFVLSIRVGPAWLAPAVLGGVPAALWFWGKQKNMFVNAAVIIMTFAAIIFSWDSRTTISVSAFVFAVIAAGLVVVRMHYASMWVGQYDSSSALLVAYFSQFLVGAGVWVFGGDVTFVLWMVVGMIIVGVVGHLSLYETAKHCSPSIAAAIAPLSVVATAAGFVLLGGNPPNIIQGVSGTIWLISGIVVAIIAQNIKVEVQTKK